MSTGHLVQVAVFAALIGALGLLPPIPLGFTPVPITLQTLGVMLAGLLLGPTRGALACVVLLLLVAAGLPVLAGGRGGLGVFLGPTAGFLWAWPLGALVAGSCVPRGVGVRFWRALLGAVIGGIVVVYLGGVAWLATAGGLGWDRATLTTLAFLPGDVVKAALAASAAVSVSRALPPLR
ncbi:MAG: biotin transporter BioY [Pseudomonadota bacterium]